MQSAVTLNSVAVRSGIFIGPSIAGVALAYGGYALPFFLNAASFLGMLLALRALQLPASALDAGPLRSGIRQGMTEGLAFVWRSPKLKAALGLEIMTGLFGHNNTLITIVARDMLGTGPQGLGLLLSALGAGALFGMALMVAFEVQRHLRLILITGALYAALWATFGLSHWLWLSAALLFVLGTADGVCSVTRNTLAQLLVPDA
jgi:predicted MFS family arabinose efflux permease